MFHKIKTLVALATLTGFVSTANAGVLIEPYLGYSIGTTEQGASENDISGVNFGARLGYKSFLGLMGGFDYMTGTLQDDANPKNDVTPSQLGVFLGYEFPILLRVYGVYGISNKAKFKDRNGSDNLEGGNNMKLGVGFTALPLVSINLEYVVASYDESNGNTLNPELSMKTYGISVSAPFDF
jgi:hypothetical protein